MYEYTTVTLTISKPLLEAKIKQNINPAPTVPRPNIKPVAIRNTIK
jgi:hypothetical protein